MRALCLVFLSVIPALVAFADEEVIWGSVVFTYHGEKIPTLHSGSQTLTPLGATQMQSAGQFLRNRYLTGNSSSDSGAMPIEGLSTSIIDNSQLEILSTTDEFMTASALSFMQGLYPPTSGSGLQINEESILANGSLVQYPVGGYQYPNIESLSELDFNYLWLAGDVGCTNYSAQVIDIIASQDFYDQEQAQESFYANLSNTVFQGLESDIINYGNAWDLYEYALYEENHNSSINSSLSQGDLARLYSLAAQQQWAYNTPSDGAYISSIAGQTLATKVVDQFATLIQSSATQDLLTVMFGSYDPFLAFFYLSGLFDGPAANAFNQNLPQYGSMMVFEMFSVTESVPANGSVSFPSSDNLSVRFLFRNGTADSAQMIQYTLFGRGNSEADMTWADFVNGMSGFTLNTLSSWCLSCDAITLFCEAVEGNLDSNTDGSSANSASSHNSGLSPAVAGVIGATVTLVLGILAGLVLCLAGFRLNHKPRDRSGNIGVLKRSASGSGGGFKGAEKLASDTDLTLKSGAGASVLRHERVGSWEMHTAPSKHASLDKEMMKSRSARSSMDGIGNVNPYGEPVKALDQV